MNKISQRVENITKHSLRGKNLVVGENDIISLAMGEPDFATPPCVIQAQADALAQGKTHYTTQTGDPLLVEAILDCVVPPNSPHTAPGNILITHGGAAGITSTLLTFINPGDVVLLENPTYSLYADAVRLAGGLVQTFGRTENGEIDFAEISKLAPEAKMIIICQPANPTGTVMSRHEWDQLTDLVLKHDLLVLSDEAYEGITFENEEFISVLDLPLLAKHSIVCRTFSKKYAMTGWRVGYLIGDSKWISAIGVTHRTFNGAVNTANQYAAASALRKAGEEAETMKLEFQARGQLMMSLLKDSPLSFVEPAGAFYIWASYPERFGDSEQVAQNCLTNGVRVRPGSEFGTEGQHAIRLSFACDRDSIREGCQRLLNVFKE